MEYNKESIRKILNEKNPLIIPKYQREYVWNQSEGEEFYNDLISTENNKDLFLGTFIFNKPRNKKDTIQVVDGQQRIMTILVFLIACRVWAREKRFSSNIISEIQRYISSPALNPKQMSSPRLLTMGRISNPVQVMSDSEWSGEYEDAMGNKHGWNIIKKPYEYFLGMLKDGYKSEAKLNQLFHKILDIEVIVLTVHNEKEAIDTFERVNARGKPLAVYDLMKAFLFSNKPKKGAGIESIEDDWEEIKNNAEDTDSKLKKVLYFFYFSKKGYVLPSKLYKELKKMANEMGMRDFVDELKLFSRFYAIVSSDGTDEFENEIEGYLFKEMKMKDTDVSDQDRIRKISKSIFSMGLYKVSFVYPLIYSSVIALRESCNKPDRKPEAKKKDIDAWIQLLKFLEHFTFAATKITHATSPYGGRLEKAYGRYCTNFSQGKGNFRDNINAIVEEFRRIIPQSILKTQFIEQFKEISYKNDKLIIYYIFDKLNNVDKNGKEIEPTNSGTPLIYTKTYKKMGHNIEHFVAKKSAAVNEFNDKENINSIGNLLVIHRRQNSKLGNGTPKEKMAIIKKWLEDGNITNKPYLEQFVKDYDKICEKDEWGEKVIEERTEKIAKQVFDITDYFKNPVIK